jgi:hypothetical protein
MAESLRRITDLHFLGEQSKNYAVYPNSLITRPSFPAQDEQTVRLFIADDTGKVKCDRAVLRVETKEESGAHRIRVVLNGSALESCEVSDTELFEPVHRNAGFPNPQMLKFYAVPLNQLIPGTTGSRSGTSTRRKAASRYSPWSWRCIGETSEAVKCVRACKHAPYQGQNRGSAKMASVGEEAREERVVATARFE